MNELMSGFFMNLEEPVFRPPREHDSLIIQATIGCSRNGCLFCAMYKGKKFRIKTPAEIEREAAAFPAPLRSGVSKIFLADANAFCIKSDDLLEMAAILKKYFVNSRFISIYASPLDILEKSGGELEALRKAGIKNLYVGLETGSDAVLKIMNKPGGFAESSLAMQKAHAAGFVLSVTLLLGIGGKKYTAEHSFESARLINECPPRFVNTLTLTLYKTAPLYKAAARGDFETLSNDGIIEEHCDFIKRLTVNRVIYRSNHVSNFIGLEGVLSRDKESLLAALSKFKQESVSNNFINLKTGGNYEI